MTIEISDTALKRLVFFAFMSGVMDRLFRWPARELGCGFVVPEMIAQVSVLRDV
jgi:tRNA-dihydrouridine synthase